jgi:GntR family transcriptional regulator
MRLSIDTTSPLPIYAQMMDQLRKAITSGTLGPGEQLPTVRQLAVDLRINPNTVARVYRELEHAGLIATRQGSGTFVASRQPGPTDEQRRAQLRRLARSAVGEAVLLGFTPADLARAIHEISSAKEVDEDA